MLEASKLNTFYGDLQVLWDVSLKVDEGDITALIGGNGAGKTTILKTISGVLRAKEGTITFLGERIDKLPAHRIVGMGLSMVPEGRHLFPLMSVLENLEIGAHIHKAKEKKKDTLEWVYQLFPILKERKKQQARTLSGGEQQMLTIARGLMSRPKLLALDEPSLGLAPKLVLMIFETLKRINEEGVTIMLVEQNVRHTLEIANKGYVLETGKVVLQGEAKQLVENDYIKKTYLGA